MGARQRLKKVFNRQKLVGADHGDDALMGGGSRQLGDLLARVLPDAHARLTAFGDQPVETIVLALAGHHHVVEPPATRPQRLFDRMYAVEDFHIRQFRRERCLVFSPTSRCQEGHPHLQTSKSCLMNWGYRVVQPPSMRMSVPVMK